MNNIIMSSSYYDTGCKDVKFKILIVDDSKTFNQKVTDGLSISGHKITQAYTLTQADNFLKEETFDFILLDLILPDGEGNELIDDMDKETRSRVIVLSGDNDDQRRNHIFESGILDYFSKSNPTHKIIDDIKKLLCTVQINSKINILLVDDSSFMRKMLTNILSPKQFNIVEAVDGEDGLNKLEDNEIHLVILDYEMPIMDGIQFIEKVKQQIEYLDLPIIMLSGHDDKNIVARALKNGASDFLKKPFAIEELLLKCDLHIKNYLNIQIIKEKDKKLIESLEKTKEAERHKAIFLANMSHEIRTPLNAIIGFVDLLAEDEKNDTKKNYLTTIQKSGDMLLNLINDVLDFSKIDSGKLDINNEIFTLNELIDLIVTLYTPMVEKKSIKFKTSIKNDMLKYMNSDFLRIKQILTNLISNAIKFTAEDGEITLSLEMQKNNTMIRFSVIDTGIGIASENHDKIFELFSQAETTTTKNFGGTGLGLSICSKLVTLLGGNISIKSELGKGSSFYVDLPVGKIDEENITYHDTFVTTSVEKSIITYDKHVLLVEDNKTNQKFMSIILSKHKLSFDIASDGYEAIELYKENKYDMIFMDENMPNITGINTTIKIRSIENNEKKYYTPIIALTANALIGDEERFREAGMDEYLTKPLNRERLSEILVKYFGRESIFEMVDQTNTKHSFQSEFMEKIEQPLELIEKSLRDENFLSLIKFINIVKIISMKYDYQDVFSLCLNLESSAKDSDIQSCRNFMLVLKGQFNGFE